MTSTREELLRQLRVLGVLYHCTRCGWLDAEEVLQLYARTDLRLRISVWHECQRGTEHGVVRCRTEADVDAVLRGSAQEIGGK